MSDATRREILAVIARLTSLGVLEATRPLLMHDPDFGEILAEQTTPPGSSVVSAGSVNSLNAYVQSHLDELAQVHQHLTGMVFGVSAGGSASPTFASLSE